MLYTIKYQDKMQGEKMILRINAVNRDTALLNAFKQVKNKNMSGYNLDNNYTVISVK